jgi:glycosyltransferase involved in cell wall biosynthesis
MFKGLSAFNKPIEADFVVIDSTFPQEKPYAFRNSEINEYIRRIDNFQSYTMYKMKPKNSWPVDHELGMSEQEFLTNRKGYLKYYPSNENALNHLADGKKYKFKLAYSFFLSETYTLLPFYIKHKIPFVFVLYPGGLFSLKSKESDIMLREIFASDYFRGVIVTQQITMDHLLQKNLCNPDDVHLIYGGFVQFTRGDVKPKILFKKHKQTLDICFVAAKYSEHGIDKGYDLFIDVAKRISAETEDVRFHVVGGFDEKDIDVGEIGDRITFYGYLQPAELAEFYSSMDIFLSPNRPFKLYEGNFDGFPLGIDAAYCGAALFVADELKMNRNYIEDEEIVVIPLDPDEISKKILEYRANPDRLYNLMQRCQSKSQQLFDINTQIDERIKVFKKYADIKMKE